MLVFVGLALVHTLGHVQAQTIPIKDHDKLIAIAESDYTNKAIWKSYQPYLYASSGCVPYPVVGADGSISGGLGYGGESWSDCNYSTGQAYVRLGVHDNRAALAYAYFFPKEQGVLHGFRYNFQIAILWFPQNLKPEEFDLPIAISLSTQSTFTWLKSDHMKWHDNHALLTKRFDNLDPGLGSLKYFKDHPLVEWTELPELARQNLMDYAFGPRLSQEFPLTDLVFQYHLKRAWHQISHQRNN